MDHKTRVRLHEKLGELRASFTPGMEGSYGQAIDAAQGVLLGTAAMRCNSGHETPLAYWNCGLCTDPLLDAVRSLRPEVLAFAIQMETVLRSHDGRKGRGGWKGVGVEEMFPYLKAEFEEVQKLVEDSDAALRPLSIFNEVVDLANIAMMVADETGMLDSEGAATLQGRER